jgi:thioredoxin reductase (NADPH)
MSDEIKDVVMIGAGPSALSAAIYTTREDIETLLYEQSIVGGLAAITDRVDNYPGFPDGIDGSDLANQLRSQAERFGAKIETGEVAKIQDKGDIKELTVDGQLVQTRAILIATGCSYSKIGIPGEAEYYGRGVHYCATCDGAFYRGKKLVVIGGGNSAIQESIYLTRFAAHIDLLVRSTIKASGILRRELDKYIASGQIKVYTDAVANEIMASNGHVDSVAVTQSGKLLKIMTDGVFVFAGLKPNTLFLDGSGIQLDSCGFIKTDNNLQTNIPGIFASGDVRSGSTMQIASAVGEGATAALNIREYLSKFE